MITNGEVTVNRRRRAGDYEHNDATVKLSFTMEGVANEEEFRCRIVDEAVTLANRGLQSTASAACAADISSKDPAPATIVASPAAVPTLSPVAPTAAEPAAIIGRVSDVVTFVPPTPPAAAPIAPPPAPGSAVSNGAPALPSIGAAVKEPIVIGLPPSPAPVPAVASPTAGGRYADKTEFQKALVAQVTRINGLRPGQGGLLVNQVIARYVEPPNGAGAIPVEKREAFMADVGAVV